VRGKVRLRSLRTKCLQKVSSQKLSGWQRSEEVATTFSLIRNIEAISPGSSDLHGWPRRGRILSSSPTYLNLLIILVTSNRWTKGGENWIIKNKQQKDAKFIFRLHVRYVLPSRKQRLSQRAESKHTRRGYGSIT
jgi:hypothetical protein